MAVIYETPEPLAAPALQALAGEDYRHILDSLPAPVYMTDATGTLTYCNRAAIAFAGRVPEIGRDKWCISWRLYTPDGLPLPLDQCPMAVALAERRPVRGVELIVERPNGERVAALPFPTPLFDSAGTFVGAINMLVDIGRLKEAEGEVQRHAARQTALYRFTDRLYRSETSGDIYEAALDAILEGLSCDRASILLFDADGKMRFVAWRGLSAAYRKAVDGHSPWRPGDRDPAPIFIEDVALSDQPETLKAVVAREGLAALAFIPLVADGEVIGKFMTYHERPHVFSPGEEELSVTIARQLGFAIQRERTRRFLDESAERLRLATQAGKVGLWDWDIPGDRIVWTESLHRMHGVPRERPAQTFSEWIARVHPEDRERVEAAIGRAHAGEAPYDLELRTLRPDGGVTWVYTNAVVIRQGGQPTRMVGATVDITGRKEAEQQRDLLVAELSHRVKNTLATVVTISRQSFRSDTTIESARASFEGRIQGLAHTHTRLAEANWMSAPVRALLEDELAPYRLEDGSNVSVGGPEVSLPAKRAVMLGMAFHELATNAAKHGSLSARGGRVDVHWRRTRGGGLAVDWREAGGPQVVSPARAGFGRLLLERAIAADLRGKVDMQFDPGGLHCRISLPPETAAQA